ncbi:LOW QUALITY PROTEIN: hypothetical protein QYF61_011361 [Mycteria americana]|uniref:Uncharacterized protein n=1 Tax=Mycteria americana TaxID=33587 RepID=A0AAN7RTS7_MYCAM|nr:LOW QUALITY PROTEIN: hypothetical protein QYF61_011361 [Mycteria americana]
MEPGSFQCCPVTGGRRGNVYMLKHRRLHLNIRKHFFAVRVTDQALAQVAQTVCEVSLLGNIQKPSGHGPGKPVLKFIRKAREPHKRKRVITITVSQASMLRGRVQGEELRAVDEGQVRDYWRELDRQKSTGLDRILPRESGENWLMSLQGHSLSSLKENKVTGNNHHGFTKDKSCQTNLIAFYDKVTGSMDDGRAADVIHLRFRRLSTLVILTFTPRCYGLGRWKTRRLYGRAQRVLINELSSTWMLITKGVPQWYLLRPVLFNTFISDLEVTVDCTLFKAADDTKWMGPDDKLEDRAIRERQLRQDGVNSL